MFQTEDLFNAKKVFTKDLNGVENGYLIELGKQGRLTTSYLTVAYPGCFKGYHLHKVREANYVCIRGSCEIEMATKSGWTKVKLNSSELNRLNIPINTPTGLRNVSDEEAWIINVPSPAYDPLLNDEQVDYTFFETEAWIADQNKEVGAEVVRKIVLTTENGNTKIT